MSIYDEIKDKVGYANLSVGPPVSADEARALGLSITDPLGDKLERTYKKYVTEDPQAAAARLWNAQTVGVPLWVQERDEMYAKEAQARLAVLNKGMPDWRWLTETAPVTARFFDDENVMASANDDVFALAGKEGAARNAAAAARGARSLSRGGVWEKEGEARRVAALERFFSADELARLRDTPVSQMVSRLYRSADRLLGGLSAGRGAFAGYEMTSVAAKNVELFARSALGSGNDEASWVASEKRMLALDREKPEGWLSGMLYETGKFFGQQAGGAWTTGLMSTAGAALGAYGATLGTGLLAAGGTAAAPVVLGGALTAAFGWWLGAQAGVFVQAAKTEGGLDLMERRMLTDEEGNHLSDFQVGLGSMTVGLVNGALELLEWQAAGRPFMGLAKRAVPEAALRSVSAGVAGRLAKLPAAVKIAGMGVKDWGSNVVFESMTEVMQDLVPITIDEMQKHALLGGYDARSLGDVSAQLTDTFTSSLYSFALISAFGPVSGVYRGQYKLELARRELEALETRRLNRTLDSFKDRMLATKLFKRFPGMSGEHTQSILEGADLSRGYIGAQRVETLFQEGLLASSEEYESARDWAAGELGISEEDYDESMRTGYEMEVAAAKVFDAVGDDEKALDAFKNDMRWSRDGMTLSEAEAAQKRIEQLKREDFFRLNDGLKMEEGEEKSARKLYEAGRIQFEEAGFDAETASAWAWTKSRVYIPLARMYNEAMPAAARKGRRFLPEDVEKMFPMVVERGEDGKVKGLVFDQSAWHGSPHRFEKFSLDHISSGEGAQAYGWGLYFAGNKEVSEWYRKRLAPGGDDPAKTGQLFKVDLPNEDGGNYLLWDRPVSAEQMKKVLKTLEERNVAIPDDVTLNGRSFAGRDYGEMIDELGEAGSAVFVRVNASVYYGETLERAIYLARSTYERDMALAGDLDGRSEYDAEMLSEQATAAREKLAWLEENKDKFSTGAYPLDGLVKLWGRRGQTLYEHLSDEFDSDKEASLLLRDAGIVGIKYLDGSSRSAGEGSYNYVIFDDRDVEIEETFYQPMNPDVDPDSFVHVVDLSGSYDGTSYSKVQDLKNKIRGMVPLELSTADHKALVKVLNRNTEHLAHSSAPADVTLNVPAIRKAAFDNLSDVVSSAVLVESIKNEKVIEVDPSWPRSRRQSSNRKNKVAFYHRLYVPVTLDGEGYKVIRLVAEEYKDGNAIDVDPKSVELYDVIPEDKISRLSAAPTNGLADLPGLSKITIREMLSNVNDFYGDRYLQNARGSITFPAFDGQPVRITFGKDADRSTFVHELGHLYLWHLKRLSAMNTAMNRGDWNGPTARWNKDLKVISGWWNERAEDIARQAAPFAKDEAARAVNASAGLPPEEVFNVRQGEQGAAHAGLSAAAFREWLASGMEKESEAGKAYDRAAQEYFARGFERYLAEGKAPTPELTSVFRRFKRWLCEIYKSLTEFDVELSEDVREVFDRMVATDEAIERLRAERELDAAMAREGVPEGGPETMEEAPDFGDDPFEAAKEGLLSGLLAKLTPERRKAMSERAEEARPQVLSEVLAEPGFKALSLLEEASEMRLSPEAVLDEFGETVVGAMPEGSLAEDGVTDLMVAARSLGFNTPKEMVDAMAGRRSLKEEVDARVREVVAREFADETADPRALDAAAEAALYDNEERSERLAAEAGADFDAALDAAAKAEEEEERFRSIFEADDAARRERDEPGSRTNVLAWIRANGYLSYRMVEAAIGGERAQELRDKLGPGMFRTRSNMGLDTAAQALSSSGVPMASDEALFKLLMSDPAPKSPIELAKAEARREVTDEYRERYAAFRQKAEAGAAADKERLAALEKKMKERYDGLTISLKDKYKAMGDKQREGFAARERHEKSRRMLDRYLKTLTKQVEGRLDTRSLRGGAKIAAENAARDMPIQKLYDVTGWVRVEKSYRLGAENALRNFDEKLFRHCKSKELHAHEMIKAIYRARKNAEFMRSRLAEYQGRGGKRTFGMSPDFLKQMDALLSRLDLERRTKAVKAALKPEEMRAGVKPLDEFIAEQEQEGVPLLIPDWIVQSNESWKYEALRMHEFEEVYKSVQNIMQTGRDEKKTIARENNLELASVEAQVLTRVQGYYGEKKVDGDTNITVAKEDPKLSADFIADLNTVEAMCRALDGYQDFGPMQDFVFRPIREAVSREYAELNRVFGAFRDLKLEVYGREFKADVKARDIGVREYRRETEAETGRAYHVATDKMSLFTRENLICAALNMGNADNIARLKDGWGWTDEEIARIADQLTEADWRYVQGVWDLLETMWPQVRKVHELMTGTTIEKVEARPLVTRFGELRGGYYPIVTDLRYSESAAAQNERQEVMASAPLDHAQRYAKSGHRKARGENVLGRPPKLSFDVLDNHVANVIHDYELSGAVRDVRKILRRDVVRSVIRSVLGDRGLHNFNGWLNDIAANTKNNGVSRGTGDRIVQGLKSNTAMFALGGNLGGALMQPLGYFPLAHRIGFVNTALAIMNGLSHSKEVYGFAYEHSEFMREQMSDGNSEVRKLRQNWTTNDHGISKAADMMLSIYPLLQNMCNVPGWVQCYKVGLKRFGTEAKAVAYADSVIRQTQSASTIADLNTFERSGTVGQMFTMFYSWFRVMYQMQNEAIMKVRYEHGLWNKTRDLASYAAYVLIAQSVAEALLRGNGPDTEDDDQMWAWAKWTAGRMLLGPLSTVPVARELGNFIDSDFKFGVKLSPVQSAFDGVGRAVKIAYKQAGNLTSGEEVDWGAVGEAGATLAGYRYGVPNRKMIQAAKAFWGYFDEGEAVPWLYLMLGGGYKPKE
ncbi:hypothetical protein [Cloacibacillus evryensis]|uniref:hypothetical protein n=2 Tax=Cloacibacillus evryensis TaxID=508460 RepID=UPI0026741E62|nr:hypothetical protein [Cloacibacillus evryensis]